MRARGLRLVLRPWRTRRAFERLNRERVIYLREPHWDCADE